MNIKIYLGMYNKEKTFFIYFESKVPKQVLELILHPYVKNEDVVSPKGMPKNHRPSPGQARKKFLEFGQMSTFQVPGVVLSLF